MNDLIFRKAYIKDASQLLEIYAPYVTETAITFEYDIPSVKEFEQRISDTLKFYPYIAALQGNTIVGYAYASSFHDRAAYSWCAEASIYIRKDCRGEGIGRRLYAILEDYLKKQGFLNLYACIACTEHEDPHLTNASIYFHEHLGYKKIGHFTNCGFKFNTWYDMVWLEKIIGVHNLSTEKVVPFSSIIKINM